MVSVTDRKSGFLIISLCSLFAWGLAGCGTAHKRGGQHPQPQRVHVALEGSTEFFEHRILAVATIDSVDRHAQGTREKPSPSSRRPPRGNDQGQGRGFGGRSNLGSRQPPVTLQVTLTNQGESSLELSIREINSALGNFVPQPDQVSLAPGESLKLSPMVSRMGLISRNVPLQVELRTGDQTESKTITLNEKTTAE